MKEYLTPSEHRFKDWLKRNPDALQLSVEQIAELYGKASSRIYQLLAVLETKGHIKREPLRQTSENITLL